ncbi:hypothetical protein Chor_015134 [Crotalus horridus]
MARWFVLEQCEKIDLGNLKDDLDDSVKIIIEGDSVRSPDPINNGIRVDHCCLKRKQEKSCLWAKQLVENDSRAVYRRDTHREREREWEKEGKFKELGNPEILFITGLSQEAGSVEQISLHCAEGSLEWLYPAGALRLSLSPRLPTGPAGKEKPQHVTACIKSSSSFRGAQIYLERDGVLELLLSETDAALQPKVRCFSTFPSAPPPPRPSTFPAVIRGNIKAVSNDREAQESIISVSATRIHRQKFALFQALGKSGKSTGSIHTLLRCGVRPGPGSFLFTGWMHFAEAWLTCAPRYKDFIRIYEEARQAHENPCEVSLD